MFKLVADKKQISKCQTRFVRNLTRRRGVKQVECRVSYRPKVSEVEVYGLPENIWMHTTERHNRYYNVFGAVEPEPGKKYRIDCEINLLKSGVNRSVAGLVMEMNGDLYLGHRCRMGGGRSGFTGSRFAEWFRDQLVEIDDAGESAEVVPIGPLGHPNFPQRVEAFVRDYQRLVDWLSGGRKRGGSKSTPSVFEEGYSAEHTGPRKSYSTARPITAICEHGEVVEALHVVLEEIGIPHGNSGHNDMFVVGEGKTLRTLFEVKTDCSLDSIYKAIGQLLFHSAPFKRKPQLATIMPDGLSHSRAKRLRSLGIEPLAYKRRGAKITFPRLQRFLLERR